MIILKRFTIAVILGILLIGFSAPILAQSSAKKEPAEQPLDRTIAIVGNQVITQNELDRSIEVAKKQPGASSLSDEALRKEVLDALITRKLLLIYAKQMGVHIDDKMVESAVKQQAEAHQLTVPELKKELEREGFTYTAFTARIREELTVQAVVQGVAQSIKITPADIAAFQKKYGSLTQYHLEGIRVPFESDTPSSAEIANTRQKAVQLVKQLRNGLSFEQAMKDHPDYPSGDLDWRSEAELPDIFLKVLPQLKINGISDPIQAENGFHIIKLLGKRESADKQQLEYQIKMEKAQKQIEEQLKKFRKQVFVKILP